MSDPLFVLYSFPLDTMMSVGGYLAEWVGYKVSDFHTFDACETARRSRMSIADGMSVYVCYYTDSLPATTVTRSQ